MTEYLPSKNKGTDFLLNNPRETLKHEAINGRRKKKGDHFLDKYVAICVDLYHPTKQKWSAGRTSKFTLARSMLVP